MFTQFNKKFYIIGSNRFDFLDLTIEGISTILKCDLIIIPKNFKKEFRQFLIENGKTILETSDLLFNNNVFFKKVFHLFHKTNKIGLLINGDPHFYFTNSINTS